MALITLWHNPRCSKSRRALTLLEERGVELDIRRYLDDAPSLEELKTLHVALGHPPVLSMVRTGETVFKEAGLSTSDADATLLQAMADHPKLIERPVAILAGKAVIGRPPERVLDLL